MLTVSAQQLSDSIGYHVLPGTEIPSNKYFEIAADSKGNVYAASNIGLTKWDGNKWYQYKFYDLWGQHTLRHVAIDSNDGVWATNDDSGALFKFDIDSSKNIYDMNGCYDIVATNSFVYGSFYKNILKIDPITLGYDFIYNEEDATVMNLHIDNQGDIWGTCMFIDKIFQLHKDSVILHSLLNGINAADILLLAVMDTNYYALITTTYPYYKLYQNGTYTNIPPDLTGDYYVTGFRFLPDSSLWLTSELGVHRYKDGTWSQVGDTDNAQALCAIANDSIAIAYSYDGISMGTPTSLTNYKGAAVEEISALAYHNNTLFLGSWDGYISQWNGSEITTAGTTNPLFYRSRDLSISPDNKLYCSGPNGVYRYANSQWESLSERYNLPDINYDFCEVDPNNNLYLSASYNGLYIVDSTGLIKHYDSSNSPIFGYMGGILYDSKDRLWISFGEFHTESDLYTLENNQFVKHEITDYPDSGFSISMLEDSKGNIWVGYRSTPIGECSLLRYNGIQWDTLHYTDQPFYYGGIEQPIMDIYEDYKGNIWIVGMKTYMYDGTSWQRFDKEGGLSQGSTSIYAVTGDGKGNIYIGTGDLGTYVLSYKGNSIEQKARKLETLSIYPNPSQGEIHLNWQNQGESTAKVYDQAGKLVFSQKITDLNPSLNLSHLEKGTYIVNIASNKTFGSATLILK
jgi:hypothetical protein